MVQDRDVARDQGAELVPDVVPARDGAPVLDVVLEPDAEPARDQGVEPGAAVQPPNSFGSNCLNRVVPYSVFEFEDQEP